MDAKRALAKRRLDHPDDRPRDFRWVGIGGFEAREPLQSLVGDADIGAGFIFGNARGVRRSAGMAKWLVGPETNVASACMGLGLIQIPRYRAAAELASGKLVEVLPQFPPSALPVHVLYSHTRQLSPRLRVVKTRHAVLAALASELG